MPIKLTKKEFILKARKVHRKKYLYHKVNYKNTRTKVKIWCRKCKKYFEQIPNSHLMSKGCSLCGGTKKLNTHTFIAKAKHIHSNKYNYDDVFYSGNKNKVVIYCNTCGNIFKQKPNSHLNGHGCRNCQYINNTNTFEDFVIRAKKAHPNKEYTYHKDKYINTHHYTKITCLVHGDFWQRPLHHVHPSLNNGCPDCSSFDKELKVKKLISKITRLKFKKVRLPELQGLELDIYNKRKRLAIEYNGEQHYPRYRGNWGFFKLESILATQKRDRKKKRLCRKYGIRLVIIPCYQWSSLKTTMEKRKYLREKLDEKNCP